MNIRFYQPNIKAYRAHFFNAFVKKFECDCVVIYGEPIDQSPLDSLYKRLKTKHFIFFGLNFQIGIYKIMRTADLNIVCFDFHWPIPIILGFFLKKKVPLLFWGHGIGKSKIAGYLKAWLINKSKGIILYGHAGKKKLLKYNINNERIFVANNTMFISNASDCTDKVKKYFLYVGRLQQRKKLDWLIEAFSEYKVRGGKYNLKIVGDGHLLTTLRSMSEFYGIKDFVEFIEGTTDDEELKNFFENAVAYVSPGDIGLGLLHAFSYGIPVVTMEDMAHGPEIEWLNSGVNGILTKKTVIAFSAALMDFDNDFVYSHRLGKAAFSTYVNEASPETMLSGFEKAINFSFSKK